LKRQALYFATPSAAEVREEPIPPPGPDEVLVKTELSAVSAGTEMLVYRGLAPGEMAVDETIAALGGSFGFPIKFGYAAIGRVIEVGAGVDATWPGRLVFAFNPHETHFVARPAALQPLPAGVAPEAAVFLPNMETAVSFLMDGRPVIGEQVAVVGQGVVGLLTTALLGELPLASLVTLDAYSLRREWSSRLGATAALSPGAPDEAIRALRGERAYAGADLTYELSGHPAGLDLAVALTGYNGRVVIGSWYGRKRVELDLGGRFHRAHMRLIGSQVSALAPEWLGRWTKDRRLGVAWEMLRRHRPERLITHRLPIDRAPDAYRLLDEAPAEAIQIVFTYP
jgi:alcohol dehydrogenase